MNYKKIMTTSASMMLLTLWLKSAFANILFIDLNAGAKEIKAAQNELLVENKGEDLFVIPNVPEKTRAQISDLLEKEDPIKENLELAQTALDKAAGTPNYPTASAEFKEAQSHFNSIEKDIHRIASPYFFDPKTRLDQEITELENSGKSFDMLVISGHNNGFNAWGVFSQESLMVEDVKGILLSHPKAASKLKLDLLWGCNSLTIGQAVWWQTNMPSVRVLGWDDTAPRSVSTDSTGPLVAAIRHRAELENEKDNTCDGYDHILTDVKKGRKKNVLAYESNSCFVTSDDSGAVYGENIKNASTNCDQIEDVVADNYDFYTSYLNCDPQFDDVPANPHSSVLRTFYEQLQNSQQCAFAQKMPKPKTVLALIFFKNIQKNFAAFFRSEINRANAVLSQIHETPLAEPANHSTTRRAVLLDSKRLSGLLNAHQSHLSSKDLLVLSNLQATWQGMLVNLLCIPDSWQTNDPVGSPPEAPKCEAT